MIGKELKLAVRSVSRSSGFTVVAVLTLALGIGASTAIFTVVRSVLLEALSYDEPDRLVRFWTHWYDYPRGSISEPEYFDYLDQNQVFRHIAIYRGRSSNLSVGNGDPERVLICDATGQFFSLLGVPALLGRTLGPDDDDPSSAKVAVVSFGLWQRSLGGDAAAVGRTIHIEGEAHTLVGVMPPDFSYPSDQTELWRTARLDRAKLGSRGNHSYNGIARLGPSVTVEHAQSDVSATARRLQEQFPDNYPEDSGFGLILVPLFEHTVGSVRPALLVLLAAVGLVLLIACANVANLTLVRATAKEKEMALRAALGASRMRLVAGSLAESSILAAAGMVLGIGVAFGCVRAVMVLGPDAVPRLETARIDGPVLGFSLLLSALTVLLFGLMPSLRVSRLASRLRQSGRTTTGRESQRLRATLVVVQIALAVVLLIGAGLLVRTFENLLQVDPGFRTQQVLTMEMTLGEDRYPDSEQRAQFFSELVGALQSLPGVVAAGAISNPPLSGWSNDQSVEVEGFDPPSGFNVYDEMRLVAGGYFETLRIPLLQGETFTGLETGDGPLVVIVSESLARKYWGEASPLGKRLRLEEDEPWRTVVGVVGDIRHEGLSEPIRPMYYLPHAQRPWREMTIVLTSTGDTDSIARSVREAAARIDRSQPVYNVRTMNDLVSENVARPRFNTLLLSAFAAVALTMAAIGIYGVLAYSVGQRTQEIGIRMALGASQRKIPWLVARQGAALVILGMALGVSLAASLSRLLSSLLFAVDERDLLTFVAAPVALAAVALLACYIPARRASRVDPIVALRNE